MEIGYPTDVKHVAHIGWDGQSGSAPSWVCICSPDFCFNMRVSLYIIDVSPDVHFCIN